MRILVVEDEKKIAAFIRKGLAEAGFNPLVCHRGDDALELALLEYLLRSPGRVLTRTQLCEQVWDYHFDPGTNVVDVCIQRLRRKLDGGFAVKLAQTVRGVGYTLKAGA